MKTVCEKNSCVGCMACIDACPVNAVSIQDSLLAYNAVIDEKKCIGCNACHNKCQNNTQITFAKPIFYKQGWANDETLRKTASSGGIASALLNTVLERNGVVCSCAFEKGEFRFVFSETVEDLPKYRGSKYVKSSPMGVYKKIESLLKNNREVLFIGLPCQVGALKTYCKSELQERLITVDLICHGTPSPKTLQLYLRQYDKPLSACEAVTFRNKHAYKITADGLSAKPGTTDCYTLGFFDGLYFTDNCYTCNYAKTERVSDITIGDSWGSELPETERKQGVSLILCQTEKGKALLENSNVTLCDVDLAQAVEHNGQLQAPSTPHKHRNKFFQQVSLGKPFNKAVASCLPIKCLKQKIKRLVFIIKGKK